MTSTDISKRTQSTIKSIVKTFADAPFPYDSSSVDQEGMQNLQLLEDLFQADARAPIVSSLYNPEVYSPILAIYENPYEMSPKECFYALPRLLVLIIHLHSAIPEYTAEMLNFLNLSSIPSSRKGTALASAGYAPETYQQTFIAHNRQCLSLLKKQHYKAVLELLLLVREWDYDNGFYQKNDVDLATEYWQGLIATDVPASSKTPKP